MEAQLRTGLREDLRAAASSKPPLGRNGPQESPLQDIWSWSLKRPAQGGAENHPTAVGWEDHDRTGHWGKGC